MNKYYKVVTLGCPKNTVDSDQMKGYLAGSGFFPAEDASKADLILVNTCGFIEDARRESINTILELSQWKKNGNCKHLIVAGCLVQKYAAELADHLPEADFFLGTGEVSSLPRILNSLDKGCPRITIGNPEAYLFDDQLPRTDGTKSHYAYLKIAEGCSNNCSYCVIPSLKGKYRSRKMEAILREAVALSQEGIKELILVAQDTTIYGADNYGAPKLPELLQELCKIQGLRWIRLLYCYPNHLSEELLDTISREPKICKYLDLPLQHISDRILKKMNRPLTRKRIEDLLLRIRGKLPGVILRSTFIVGFPGETRREFEELYDFIGRARFDRAGFFAFSKEEGTPAGELPDQLAARTVRNRLEKIALLQEEILASKQAFQVGKIVEIIVDGPSGDYPSMWEGRTAGDAPEIDGVVYFSPKEDPKPGDFIRIQVTHSQEYSLMGEIKG